MKFDRKLAHEKIAALIKNEEDILDGDRFWLALTIGPNVYLSAWIDERGELCHTTYKNRHNAIKVASSRWGR